MHRGGILFVIDGAKALHAAIGSVFGTSAEVQRCRRHEERNVTDHLPEVERPLVLRRLRAAWAEPDPAAATARLEAIARGLAHQRPGAAASLREGLADRRSRWTGSASAAACCAPWSPPTPSSR
jgi:transposase-like protein